MSKWILISTDEDGDIMEPDVFDDYNKAYGQMVKEVMALKDDLDTFSIHKDYASVQSAWNAYNWRIYEVEF